MIRDNAGDAALHHENERLQAQNEELRNRVEELERRLALRASPGGAQAGAQEGAASSGIDARRGDDESVRETLDLVLAVIESPPLLLFVKDAEGRYLLANRHFLAWAGMDWDRMRGRTDHELFPQDMADSFKASDADILASDRPMDREDSYLLPDGQLHHFLTTKFALRDVKGKLRGVCGVATDITAFKQTEAENQRLKDEIIRAQEASLSALSTPLLPIATGVVVMPLIGNIDRTRAQRVLEALLDGIVRYEASKVILDVTGVPLMDSEVADSLVTTARAVRLLGASVIVTGIQPSIAQTLVQLGADLSGIITDGTLESGITRALKS